MSRATNLTRMVINLTQNNARVPCVISAPQARSATEAFESVMRMMRAPHRSACYPGDVIVDRDEFYTLAYFNKTARDKVFRMFHTPIKGQQMRREISTHPVTNLPMSESSWNIINNMAYFNVESRTSTQAMEDFKSSTYRLITGVEVAVGDALDLYQIMDVRFDNGIYYCVAKDRTK